MKKLIFVALLSIAAMPASQAQFALGAGGGVNFSNARFSGLESFGDAKGITGFHVSVQPRYVFARRWSAITDLQYSRKGAILESANSEFGQRADYIDLLPQVEYRLLEHLGVAVGVNVGWSIREETKYDDSDWQESILALDLFDDPDFGLLFALRGYYGRFYGTVSYNLGLKNVNTLEYTDDNGSTINVERYHRNLQIGVGYLLLPGHSADK